MSARNAPVGRFKDGNHTQVYIACGFSAWCGGTVGGGRAEAVGAKAGADSATPRNTHLCVIVLGGLFGAGERSERSGFGQERIGSLFFSGLVESPGAFFFRFPRLGVSGKGEKCEPCLIEGWRD